MFRLFKFLKLSYIQVDLFKQFQLFWVNRFRLQFYKQLNKVLYLLCLTVMPTRTLRQLSKENKVEL